LNLTQQLIGKSSMNQVSVSTSAGKLFWISIVGYSAAFAGFYGLTQYAQARISLEESSGVIAAFKDSACNHQPSCSEFTLNNMFDATQKKLITHLTIPYKQKQSIDQVKLQQDYSALIAALPWVVRRQFSGTLEINASNNIPAMASTPSKTLTKSHKK
jgi:hypothetical protein